MIRTLLLCGICLVVFSGLAPAGQISGRLSEGGRPLPEGVKVFVNCGGSVRDSATDRFGSYHIFQPATGQCTLQVHYGARPATAEVASYPDPVTFDFELVRSGDSYILRRR